MFTCKQPTQKYIYYTRKDVLYYIKMRQSKTPFNKPQQQQKHP